MFVPSTRHRPAAASPVNQAVEHAPQIERVVSGAVTQGERFLAPKVERFLGDAKNEAVDLAESCVLRRNSFAAGTLVLMADGTMRPIEQVRVGDLVMAGDPQRGIQRAEPVTDVIVGHGLKHLYDIQVDSEVIEATYNHPFWVVELQTFVWAQDLVPGEHLLLADGRAPPITAISRHDEITTVYNLSIAQNSYVLRWLPLSSGTQLMWTDPGTTRRSRGKVCQ